jgi:hypothetical protein
MPRLVAEFGMAIYIPACAFFNGSAVSKTHSSNYPHLRGGLAYYNGQPTTVGHQCGFFEEGKVETLSPNGWSSLANHPKYGFISLFTTRIF